MSKQTQIDELEKRIEELEQEVKRLRDSQPPTDGVSPYLIPQLHPMPIPDPYTVNVTWSAGGTNDVPDWVKEITQT